VTLEQALRQAREAMSQHNIEDAALEAEILLRHTLHYTRAQLYLELNRELNVKDTREYNRLVERRLAGEPTAYITNHREFYGLDFYVDSRVLIPRPESELLVDEAIKSSVKGARSFADIGTGSGAIAISLAVNVPQVHIFAVDISPDALAVAQENCRKHGVHDRIDLLQGDLLEPLPGMVDVVLANLPYVKQIDLPAVNTNGYEPRLALDGGSDGLITIRRLIRQITRKTNPRGRLCIEIGLGQEKSITDYLNGLLPEGDIKVIADLSGIPRVVVFTLPGESDK
jgi:release factor glutamine methyltransferase